MVKIFHKLTIETPANVVSEKITTIDGLKAWWMKQSSGNPSEANGEIEFGDKEYFYNKVKVTELEDTRITWEIIESEGPSPEMEVWNGTTIEFSLEEKQLERLQGKTATVVLFKHEGLPEGYDDTKNFAEMNWYWVYSLLSLKNVCEGKPGMSM